MKATNKNTMTNTAKLPDSFGHNIRDGYTNECVRVGSKLLHLPATTPEKKKFNTLVRSLISDGNLQALNQLTFLKEINK